MKTAKEINEMLDNSLQELENKSLKKGQIKRIENNIAFYRMCLRHIETKPRPEFIRSEIDRIKNKLDLISDNYKYWTPSAKHSNKTNLLKCYESEMEVPKYKAQLKTLNFLFN